VKTLTAFLLGRLKNKAEKKPLKSGFFGATEKISCACRGSRCRSLYLALSAWRCSPRWSDR
jgi:hypothetical protein